jgi:hypothetical protein
MQFLKELDDKFRDNLKIFMADDIISLKEIDQKARSINELGHVLSEITSLSLSQKEITLVYDEVFADIILSTYFTACALDKPAQAVLRRALELGVAIVYLWDLPHAYWGWKSHDSDLKFDNMIEHLSKPSYQTFIKTINPKYKSEQLFDYTEVNRVYRFLSNTIHGKISTHEAILSDRFSFNPADCQNNIVLIIHVQDILLELFKNRFPNSFEILMTRMPHINK